MSERISIIDDLSNARVKARLIAAIGGMQGTWRVEMCRYRPRRTDRQNRYYWPCFVKPFADYLVEQGNEFDDAEDSAHEILKREFLSSTVTDRKSGQVFTFQRSTTKLTTVEFNAYLDRCARMLAEECGIVVPEPNVFHEPPDREEVPEPSVADAWA